MNKKEQNNKGFSLVELIIVIAIMAILVGVLAPQLYKYTQKAKESTDITNLDTCVSVVQAAFAEKGYTDAITINKEDGVFHSDNTDAQAALEEAGADKTAIKGPWTKIEAEISKTGTVTYTAEGGNYYEVKDNVFVQKEKKKE